MTTHNKRTREDLQRAVSESKSIAQVIRSLGLVVAGGNYNSIQQEIREYGIDTSHFSGKGWSRGTKIGPKRPIKDYLNNTYRIKSYQLKRRLVSEGYKTGYCEICNIDSWLGNKLVLELDHIDGDHNNNNLSNLRILCPNCHSQTDTFRGRNIGKKTMA